VFHHDGNTTAVVRGGSGDLVMTARPLDLFGDWGCKIIWRLLWGYYTMNRCALY